MSFDKNCNNNMFLIDVMDKNVLKEKVEKYVDLTIELQWVYMGHYY